MQETGYFIMQSMCMLLVATCMTVKFGLATCKFSATVEDKINAVSEE